jgi:hypothetical protein
MNINHKIRLGACALVLFCVHACSSEDPVAPSRPPIPPPVAPSVDGGSGGDGGPASTCFDTTKNKPTDPRHFLNQCNSTECFKFDNVARIEGFHAGQPLPPLN